MIGKDGLSGGRAVLRSPARNLKLGYRVDAV